MKRAFALVALLGALVIGCGDDDSGSTGDTSVTPTDASVATVSDDTSTVETTSTDDDFGELDAIESTIKTWLLEGDCDLMTDKFLEDQTFISDPKQACDTFESSFAPPQYSEEDIDVGDVQYENDKATAEVGGGGVDITSVYKLVYEDGVWKIDAAELG